MRTEKLIEIVSSALADELCDGCEETKPDIPCWKCRDEASKIVTQRLREYEAQTKHGEWIETDEWMCGTRIYRCSECGGEIDDMPNVWYRFCPHCGARLRGDNDE